MESSSISARKSAFLTTQIRLLSAPLHPSPAFTSALHSASGSETQLPTKTVDEVVTRVNDKIKAHNKLVFSAQTQRHIVEQIESLYFAEALADDDAHEHEAGEDGEELVAIERDRDLTDGDVIGGLPEELQQAMLNDISDLGMDEEQADRYTHLRAQVLELSAQRDAARENLQRYNKLQALLRPFEDAQNQVQPNLVTKDGEMSRELERMRVLLARVTGRMGEADILPERATGQAKSSTFEDKLKRVMEMDTT